MLSALFRPAKAIENSSAVFSEVIAPAVERSAGEWQRGDFTSISRSMLTCHIRKWLSILQHHLCRAEALSKFALDESTPLLLLRHVTLHLKKEKNEHYMLRQLIILKWRKTLNSH